ncbi:mucoidy inhibitor-like protein [Colletotrichum truncatum]|uniref:Mucoidy inhibitor-like protein n=1 Tax=Colletotrichum truncatum TaxID=5467 RepID=A0ACC3ZL88_COLTU|nr:mucoidy inhibitor-like protein [Colletotrichum truncatum]KAF6786983.1 mucoidy inhibitor-like protein [Colletotrichum truncatum]
MEAVEKREYHIRDLTTRSVTLFPTRAQIVRDLKSLPLKPGTNEVLIIGLTPTVDESTIRVEGTGSAVISNIATELLPNRDIFQEVYPDDDSDASDEDSDTDDYTSDPSEPPELLDARAKHLHARDEERRADEIVDSATSRLKFLDSYANSLDRKENVDITGTMDEYRKQREKAFNDKMEGVVLKREAAKQTLIAYKVESRLEQRNIKEIKRQSREKARSQREKKRERLNKERRKEEANKEKQRIRKERESFWPKVCYSVRITLEVQAATPMTSRRTSVSSSTVQAPAAISEIDGGATSMCDLSLSYITSSAFWEPGYDIQLSTTNNNTTICYDAKITNHTSETWADCKVTLSTPQATFSGLDQEIPSLKQWNIKLATRYIGGRGSQNILTSQEERRQRALWRKAQDAAVKDNVDRNVLFGIEEDLFGAGAYFEACKEEELEESDEDMGFALYDDEVPQVPEKPAAQSPSRSLAAKVGSELSKARRESKKSAMECERDEGGVDFEESFMEETGFTTAYDLPGTQTLPPASTASKQRVTRLHLSNVVFSHTVVPKYKTAAFLKAKIRNGSRITLLKGAAGLTLDGTFMGRTTLPRCSAGDVFSLSLGMDPAIVVSYPTVNVRRATTGFLSKENSSVYMRSITITNSRAAAGKPVSLLVMDQVPVSEDERLKVEIVAPKGMSVNGSGTTTGEPGRSSTEDSAWGRAKSSLKKGGQVEWEVDLNAGKAVKLGLEYVLIMPSGDDAVEC